MTPPVPPDAGRRRPSGPVILLIAIVAATLAFGLMPNEWKAMWMFYVIMGGLAFEAGWLFKILLK